MRQERLLRKGAIQFTKKVFREQIAQLRKDVTMRRLYRWELKMSMLDTLLRKIIRMFANA